MSRERSEARKDVKKAAVRKKKDLPPCRVCDAPAAGFHYGANTCEACKGFFHRSLRFFKQYVCERDGTCLIQFGQKKMCQKCRHDKCVAVGMAKDAIKTGRYTTSKHTMDILELKRLQFKESLERRSKSRGVFSRALANDLGPGILKRENIQRTECSDDPSRSAQPFCKGCDQEGISFRCLNNINSCPTIRHLHRQIGGTKNWFLHIFASISIQDEPIYLKGTGAMFLGQKERKRILEKCFRLPDPYQESSSTTSSVMDQPSDHCCSQVTSKGMCQSGSCPNSYLYSPSSLGSSISSPESLDSNFVSCPHLGHQERTPSSSQGHKNSFHSLNHDMANSSMNHHSCNSCESVISDMDIADLYSDKEQVLCNLTDAYERFVAPHLHIIPKDELERKAAEYLETCRIRREMFGTRTRIPDPEYDLIFESTGIDVDDRLPRFDSYVQVAETMIRDTVKFSKSIPGFCQLPLQIKINLIKYAAPDMVVLDVYRNICLKHNVSFQADGTLLSIDDFAIDHPDSCQERVRNFYSSHMKMSRELQDFDFTIEEETLLRAIFIMSPDRELYSPGELASRIYEQLHGCFIHLLEKRQGNTMMLYAKFMDLLIKMRVYNHNVSSYCKLLHLKKYSRLVANPMLRLMMNGILFDEEEDQDSVEYNENFQL